MGSAMDMAVDNASKALDTSGIGKASVEGLQVGMSLADRQAKLDQANQEMQFQKKQHEMQKHDWMHDQLKSALSEDDPKLRSVLLDNMDQQFPKLFDGKRIDPQTLALMEKSPSFMDKMLSAVRVREALRSGNSEHLTDFDSEVMNGMTSADISTKLGHLNTIKSQETAIIKSLTAAKVATPQAAATAGQSQEQVQETMNRGNVAEVRRARLAMSLDDQASKTGKTYDSDKKLTNLYTVNQKAERDLTLINDKSRPFTSQNAAEVEATIPMLLGGAGSASLGATERIEMQTAQRQLSNLIQKWSGKPDDLRERDPALVDQIKHTVERLLEATGKAQEDVAVGISKDFEQSDNPKVHAVNQAKLHQYAPNHYAKTYGSTGAVTSGGNVEPPAEPPASEKITQDVLDQFRVHALERVRQIKAAEKSGHPLAITEQQVKEVYKNKTGKELVE